MFLRSLSCLVQICYWLLMPLWAKAFQAPDLQQQRQIAEQWMLEGQFDRAFESYGQLWAAYNAAGKTELAIRAREEHGAALVWRHDWKFQQKYAYLNQQRATLFSNEGEAFYQGTLAHLLASEGKTDQVHAACTEAIRLYRAEQQLHPEAFLYIRIAFAHYEWQALDSALHYLHQAEQLNPAYQARYGEVISSLYNLQTIIYSGLGQHEKALKSSLADIALLLQANNEDSRRALTYEYNNLASLYQSLGDNHKAITYYHKALKLHQQIHYTDTLEWAICHHNLGTTYRLSGERLLAKRHVKKGLALLQKLPAHREVQTVLIDLYHNASFLHLKTEPDAALHYLEQAKRLQKHLPYRWSVTYSNMGFLHEYQGEFQQALYYYQLALAEHQKSNPEGDYAINTWNKIAHVQYLQKDPFASLRSLQEAFKIVAPDYQPQHWYDCPTLDQFERISIVPELLRHQILALQQCHQMVPLPQQVNAIYETTQIAIQTLEKLNRSLTSANSKKQWLNNLALPFFETAISASLNLAQQTNNPSYNYQALALAEQSQSMMMMDNRVEQQAAQRGGVPDSLLNYYQQCAYELRQAQKEKEDAQQAQQSDQVTQLDQRIFQYRQTLDQLQYKLEQDYPAYRRAKYQPQNIAPKDLQKALSKGTVLLEYFEGQETIYVFCLTPDTLYTHQFPHDSLYDQCITRFLALLRAPKAYHERPAPIFRQLTTDAYQLYQWLIAPVLPHLPQRLLIVPDGQLAYLPFGVLLTKPILGDSLLLDFSALPYVLRQSTVNYLLSGGLWLEQCQHPPSHSNKGILGFAPSYAPKELPPWRQEREQQLRRHLVELPGATEEVAHLADYYQGDYFTAYTASERVFKELAPQYSILHLALHGIVNVHEPHYSGLAMAENADSLEDNFLYLYEIQHLSLNPDLVVLSACETGTGQYQRGEGVLSIGRGFVYAGAPALLTTLWSLNDQSSTLIMKTYYEYLAAGAAKDEAIRQAQLYYIDKHMKEFSHPYLWASFIPVGNYNPIVVEPISYKRYYSLGCLTILLIFWFVRKRKNLKK